MWVKSEYASELAVLSAWLSVLLPWNVSFRPVGQFGDMLFVYFPFFQIQYTWLNLPETATQSGIRLANGVWIADPVSAAQFYQGGGSGTANWIWVGAAGVFLVAFGLSLAMYFNEEGVADAAIDEVRAMGGLLGAGAVLSLLATVVFWQNSPGVQAPVGAVLVAILAGILLTIDRTDSTGGEAPPTDEEGDGEADPSVTDGV